MLDIILAGLFIFTLRVTDVSLGTVRVLMVIRGRKLAAWLLGFGAALVYIIAMGEVFDDLGNWIKILGYAAGFATGSVVGMWIEELLAVGYLHLRIISASQGERLANRLRAAGYGVTELTGRGRDGTVGVLDTSIERKRLDSVRKLVKEVDASAFITSEEVRRLRKGYWG